MAGDHAVPCGLQPIQPYACRIDLEIEVDRDAATLDTVAAPKPIGLLILR